MNLLPVLRLESWMSRAACKGAPGEQFDATTIEEAQAALAYCQRCPVRADCADYAARHGETGVWGGKVFDLGQTGRTTTCNLCGELFVRRNRKSVRQRCYTCRAPYGSQCGTSSGAYRRHLRRGEPPCDDCKAAESARRRRQ